MRIPREIEGTIDRMLKQGKVVLVTGARQVGKTTVLKHHLGGSYNYVTLEDPAAFLLATQDALLFFRSHELPLIIDEVQRTPQLFSTVKYLVDESEAKGTVVLTGSQTLPRFALRETQESEPNLEFFVVLSDIIS